MEKIIRINLEDLDGTELKLLGEKCLGELRERQASYLDGLSEEEDKALIKDIGASVDTLDEMVNKFDKIG